MEPYEAYKKAMKVINIIYICEQRTAHISFNDISAGEMIKIIFDLFYVYDTDNKILNLKKNNLTEVDTKDLNDTLRSEIGTVCMEYFDCNDCYIKDITEAVKSTNLTYEKHIRRTNILQYCNLIYFLSSYKFKPKMNTDDWENF